VVAEPKTLGPRDGMGGYAGKVFGVGLTCLVPAEAAVEPKPNGEHFGEDGDDRAATPKEKPEDGAALKEKPGDGAGAPNAKPDEEAESDTGAASRGFATLYFEASLEHISFSRPCSTIREKFASAGY